MLLARATGTSTPRFAFRFAAAGIAIVVLCLGSVTGAYAYASPGVVEGHPLFQVKHGIESVEGRFARSSEQRARFHVRMMERRMTEAERFVAREEQVGVLLESAAEEFDLSVGALPPGMPSAPAREEIVRQLGEQGQRYGQAFRRMPMHDGQGSRVLPPPERIQERLEELAR
jgi:hypothetical protein